MIGKLSDEKLALKVNELKSELDEIISKTKLLEDSAESYGMMASIRASLQGSIEFPNIIKISVCFG